MKRTKIFLSVITVLNIALLIITSSNHFFVKAQASPVLNENNARTVPIEMSKYNIVENPTLIKQPMNDKAVYAKNVTYRMQTNNFGRYKTQHADYVMLGDSITYSVQWHEMVGNDSIVNRGIGGDYTEGMLNRLDSIIGLKSKKVFIMAGINDLMWNAATVDKAYYNYKLIIEKLKSRNITPVVTSTLYVSTKVSNYKSINEKVDKMNAYLKQYAKKNQIEFIDLNAKLSKNKALESKHTIDGVHIYGEAYDIWATEVRKEIDKK